MEINRIVKFLITSFLMFSLFSCKGENKDKNLIIDNTSIIGIKKKDNISLDNVQVNLEPKALILEFYSKYIKHLEDPLNEESLDNEVYLTEDLINEIGKNWEYDYITKAQDSNVEWLKTLKVEDTKKDNVYSVSREKGYYDSSDNIIYVTIVELEKGKLKISKISSSLDDQLVSSIDNDIDQDDGFTYYAFNYKINPGDRINETSYIIEYLEEEYIVFVMMGHEGNFDYKCRQVRTNEGVSLYYKESMNGGKEYTGDKSKPIVKIYKIGNNFYAKSSLIENGKEVKLKEVESRY